MANIEELKKDYEKCFHKEYNSINEMFCDIFNIGITWGLLIAEQERYSEGVFDAAICFLTDEKYVSPSVPTKTRQPHSEEWFKKSQEETKRFWEGIMKLQTYKL